MGGRLVESLYDVTNYAKPMARDEQYLSRTKQTKKHKRQDFLGLTTSLPRKGHYRNTIARDDGRDIDDYTGTRRRQ